MAFSLISPCFNNFTILISNFTILICNFTMLFRQSHHVYIYFTMLLSLFIITLFCATFSGILSAHVKTPDFPAFSALMLKRQIFRHFRLYCCHVICIEQSQSLKSMGELMRYSFWKICNLFFVLLILFLLIVLFVIFILFVLFVLFCIIICIICFLYYYYLYYLFLYYY